MKKNVIGVLSLFFLTGCLAETTGGPTEIAPLRSPAEANQEVRHQSQGNIIGDYIHRSPTDPGEWRKLNNEQTNPLGGGS